MINIHFERYLRKQSARLYYVKGQIPGGPFIARRGFGPFY